MNTGRLSLFMGIVVYGLLSFGSANADPLAVIKEAQKNLKKLRFYDLAEDGIFGSDTRKAVLQYQYEMNLPVTGVLDNHTIKKLKQPPIILNTQNFAPFHYKAIREGSADGPLPQIVQRTCSKAGLNCRIIMYDDWRLAQQDVKKGKAEGLFVIAWNSGRAKWLHRSTALVETEYGLFVRDVDHLKFNEALRQPSLLGGYTVGVYGPSGTSNSLAKLKTSINSKGVTLNIDMKAEDRLLFQKLSLSTAKYAVYSNRIVGESIIKGSDISNVRYAGRHRGLAYYVGFSKQLVPISLVYKFNEAFLSLVDQGEAISIMANYNVPIPKRHRKGAAVQAPKTEEEKKETPGKRFRQKNIQGVTVVQDSKTCLMWQQSGTKAYIDWDEATDYVLRLNTEKHAGYSDWRLPSIGELQALMKKKPQEMNQMHIDPIFDALQQSCWSGDKRGADIKYVDFFDGISDNKDQGDTNFVRAVRTEECTLTIQR